MPHQVLVPDKSEAAEQKMFAVLRALEPRERARLASRHNGNAMALMRTALRVTRLGWDYERLSVEWARIHFGEELAAQLEQIMLQPHQSSRSASAWAMVRPGADDFAMRMLSLATGALDELGVAWFIGGSFAACANGYGRPHRDIDIIVPGLSHEQGKYLHDTLGGEFFCGEAVVGGSAAWNFVHLGSAWTVDVFAPTLGDYEREALKWRWQEALFGGDALFWVESPMDCILSRLRWIQISGQREQAWEDAVGVLKVRGVGLDLEYLDQWAPALGVSEMYEKALEEAGLKEIRDQLNG